MPHPLVSQMNHDIVHVEMMLIDHSSSMKGNLTCSQTLIDCQDKDKPNLFINHNTDLRNPPKDRFEYGVIGVGDVLAQSKTEKYKLVMQENGNLAVMHHSLVHWENKMGYFENFENRYRINEKGLLFFFHFFFFCLFKLFWIDFTHKELDKISNFLETYKCFSFQHIIVIQLSLF